MACSGCACTRACTCYVAGIATELLLLLLLLLRVRLQCKKTQAPCVLMLASGKHLGAHLPETHARHASLLPGCTVHTRARSVSSPTGCTPAGAQEIMPARAARPCSPSLAAAAAVAGVSGTDSHATTACASFKAQRTPASLVSYGMVGEGGTGARQRSRSVNPWRPGDVPPRAAREAPHPG